MNSIICAQSGMGQHSIIKHIYISAGKFVYTK